MQPHTSYIICSTPRSGSFLLCEALRNTGLAGYPDEYFGPMHVPKWSKQWNVSTATDYINQVTVRGSTPNGVCGVKIMRLYWADFIAQLRKGTTQKNLSETDLISSLFPNLHHIWITRRNKVRQAVSWAKAMQGVPWIWEKDESFIPEQELKFKYDIIDQFIEEVVIHEAAWQEYFSDNAITPFVVVYEDFVQAYRQTAVRILDYLGIAAPSNQEFGERRLQKQADALSEEWVRKYQKMKQAEWVKKGWQPVG